MIMRCFPLLGIDNVQSIEEIFIRKNWGRVEGLSPFPEIAFHADFNELVFVYIALRLAEILMDCDHVLLHFDTSRKNRIYRYW